MEKILVIDDEKPTLNMFRLFLGAYGYTALVAENAAAGLEVFRKEKPSIVFTDIKMPGMDGFEVLKQIKEIDPMTEVIVITGHGDNDLAIQALRLNATDFINKPIDGQTLEAALKRAKKRSQVTKSKEQEVSLRTADDVAIIDIRGNVSSLSEPFLLNAYEKICEKGSAKILLHFDYSSSINGAGIAVLIRVLSESKKRNQAVAIAGLSENFRKIFHIVGIAKLARIFDSEQDAVSSL